MDDIIVLGPTRWKPWRAVQALLRELHAWQLERHPGKTFIGGIEKGLDFLGYRFTPRSLTVARKTIENFLESALRLYEQEPLAPPTAHDGRGARGLPTA